MAVDAGRGEPHLAPPGQVLGPAVRLQVMGDRGEHVGRGSPDVPVPVLVEIDGPLQVARRHELRLPHGAGPRAAQGLEGDVAAIDDLQGIEQFTAEERAAPPFPRQRRQRLDGRPDAAEAAEVRFQAPDGDDVPSRHAVGRLHGAQQIAMAGRLLGCGPHHGPRQAPRDVLVHREHDLRLRLVALDHRRRRLEVGQRPVDDGLIEAAGQRLLTHAFDEGGKIHTLGRRRRGDGDLRLVASLHASARHRDAGRDHRPADEPGRPAPLPRAHSHGSIVRSRGGGAPGKWRTPLPVVVAHG